MPGPFVLIAVRDTGDGMDAEARARVFEPFFAPGEHGKGSLGLGDGVRPVRQNGGHIEVDSEPGAGTLLQDSPAAGG